jgi:hypothetical protein
MDRLVGSHSCNAPTAILCFSGCWMTAHSFSTIDSPDFRTVYGVVRVDRGLPVGYLWTNTSVYESNDPMFYKHIKVHTSDSAYKKRFFGSPLSGTNALQTYYRFDGQGMMTLPRRRHRADGTITTLLHSKHQLVSHTDKSELTPPYHAIPDSYLPRRLRPWSSSPQGYRTRLTPLAASLYKPLGTDVDVRD